MDEESYFKKQMEKLEREQKGLRDNYNTLQKAETLGYYEKRLNTAQSARYAIHSGESISMWLIRFRANADVMSEQGYDRHKSWYTHTGDPRGCCFCDPCLMLYYSMLILGYFAKKYPNDTPFS